MDKSWINIVHRTRDERYKLGVENFLTFAYKNKEESAKITCPCNSCNNFVYHDKLTVMRHLLRNGMKRSYVRWIYHGERCEHSNDETDDEVEFDLGDSDDLDDLINDIGHGNLGENWQSTGGSSSSSGSDANGFLRLLDEARQDLYPGCEDYTKLSFIVTLLHLKTISGWTSKSFDALLGVFMKVLPKPASVPKSFYEAKKIIRDLGLQYEKIDACVNDCILFRNEHALLDTCPNDRCKEPRYKVKDSKVPRKVLRYFPLKPRLQRLFINKEVSFDMRWHKDKRVNDDNIMRHPADSEAWKHFDRVFPSFANDPRSVRLGLATDGFNPFGNLSNAYSLWPVFLVPYNLPPWKCMKDPFVIMSMLIPGPKSPGKDIDVYLQPLIDELNELWIGIEAYDAFKKEKFILRASLLWTISDFPVYAMLSG